jgi:hypothetical protein
VTEPDSEVGRICWKLGARVKLQAACWLIVIDDPPTLMVPERASLAGFGWTV